MYKVTITVPQDEINAMNAILERRNIVPDCACTDLLKTYTADFGNGLLAQIKLCKGLYVAPVPFQKGQELVALEVTNAIDGQYAFQLGEDADDTYVVEIVGKKTETLPFTPDEILTILEAARLSLGDADIFDEIADGMDIADKDLCELREKLQTYLDAPKPGENTVTCRKCGSGLDSGYCKDETCPYSDWPQIVDVEYFWFDASTATIEEKYGIKKRPAGLAVT